MPDATLEIRLDFGADLLYEPAMVRRVLSCLLVCACAAAAAVWHATHAAPLPPAAPSAPVWRYANEQSWLVADTLQAIIAVGALAEGRDAPSGPPEVRERRPAAAGSAAFDVEDAAAGGSVELVVREHIFSPDSYAALARSVLGAGSPGTPDAGLVTDLATPTVETLDAASSRVSEALARDPRSAAAHADAALVLAAFAFREAAAGHTDPRRELTRMTAHLAMSRAIAPGRETAAGRLAHLTLLVLAGRRADAVSRLEALPQALEPGEAAWRRALRMRATGDWRTQTWAEAGTLLERLAWARAFEAGVGSDRFYLLLGQRPRDEQVLPDWGRLKLFGSVSVRTCHSYATEGAAEYDLAEARHAAQRFRAQPLRADQVVDALNEESPGPVSGRRITVLDWGRWAAFEQRHLGARLSYALACTDRTFGLPERVPAELARQEEDYGRLRLLPFEAQRVTRTPADHARYAGRAAQVVRQRPELVTPHLWNLLHQVPAFTSAAPPVPPPSAWFDPASPLGTFFEDGHGGLRPVGQASQETIAEYVRLNPYNLAARWRQIKARHGDEPPYAALVQEYGPALEWSLNVMRYVAKRAGDQKEEQRGWLARVCEADADSCSGYAAFLRDSGDKPAAADVFRRYWREGEDRVAVSNRMRWLVEYDEEQGRAAEAEEIARDVAETYSCEGLETLAWLLEKRGDWPRAADVRRKVVDRYESGTVELYRFYGRAIAAGQARYARDRDALVAEVFPGGRQALSAPPAGPPAAGALLSSIEPAGKAAGLERGDVVVALDGIEVRSSRQLGLQRLLGSEPVLRLLVYREGAHKEVVVRSEKRVIPASFDTFPRAR